MIKYRLICANAHEVDGWFPSNREFTKQKKSGQLICPICNSRRVDKAIMAPGISDSVNARRLARVREDTLSTDQMMPASQAQHVLRQISRYVKKNFENVGDRFYGEAVKCDDGDRDDQFYGTPTKKETDKLLEKGIDLFHVPKLKDN